jgi:hypothetical protein
MRRRVPGSARAAAFFCLGLACMAASEASAHRRSTDSDAHGIPIAALSHGQMAVISDYRSEILDLAARESRTDETFRRLLNFGSIQHTYCLWGLVPGSLKDETSPFNECSHAYLSAARELLAHMRQTSANKQAVEDLISLIDADMVRSQASFVECQYSSESFNTAGLVYPAWGDVPSHLPSLAAFAGLAVTIAAGSLTLGGGIRRKSGNEKHPG